MAGRRIPQRSRNISVELFIGDRERVVDLAKTQGKKLSPMVRELVNIGLAEVEKKSRRRERAAARRSESRKERNIAAE